MDRYIMKQCIVLNSVSRGVGVFRLRGDAVQTFTSWVRWKFASKMKEVGSFFGSKMNLGI